MNGRRPSGAGRKPARGLDDGFDRVCDEPDVDPDDLFDVGDDSF